MASLPISGLPATAALTGAELAVLVQGGVTSQSTAQAIANLRAIPTLYGQPGDLPAVTYIPPPHTLNVTGVALVANQFTAHLIYLSPAQLYDGLGLFVDALVAGTSVKACLYDVLATGLPGNKVAGTDAVISTAAIGNQMGAWGAAAAPPIGFYWLAGVSSGAATVRGISGADPTQANFFGSSDPVRFFSGANNFTAKSGVTTFAAGCPAAFGAATDFPAGGGNSGMLYLRTA